MSKLTPGPWKWNEIGYCWLEGADGSTILHIDDFGNECPHRDSADARLIAVAPDLLEAAKKAIDALNTFAGNDAKQVAQEILQNAIAKAEPTERIESRVC